LFKKEKRVDGEDSKILLVRNVVRGKTVTETRKRNSTRGTRK